MLGLDVGGIGGRALVKIIPNLIHRVTATPKRVIAEKGNLNNKIFL